MLSSQNALASALFAGIADGYDRWADVFSLFQYRRWHNSLLAALNPRHGDSILDVSTGTGAVALDLAARGCTVVGLDISRAMLREALRRAGRFPQPKTVCFAEGRAEELPFPASSFDAVTFTFLLRYVSDPAQPVREIARVLRPGGRVAMLEFGIPAFPITRALWSLYAFALLPFLARLASPEWARVGAFLGGSIAGFYRQYPLSRLIADWERAGFTDVTCRPLSFGGAIVVTAVKA
jgi:demethylmenaquinone methyltransferase/2-methoxy-6-polyprenyl-1,4-benzoquinol methylase